MFNMCKSLKIPQQNSPWLHTLYLEAFLNRTYELSLPFIFNYNYSVGINQYSFNIYIPYTAKKIEKCLTYREKMNIFVDCSIKSYWGCVFTL